MLMIGWGAFAQDQDTHIIDGRIIYQHVFDGALDNPLVFLENLRGISNVRETDGALFADWRIESQSLRASMRAVGLNAMNTMIFLSRPDHSAQVQLEIKDGRYRVTVSDIICRFESDDISDAPIETFCIRNNGNVRANQFRQTRDIYNHLATTLFSGQAVTPTNDDW